MMTEQSEVKVVWFEDRDDHVRNVVRLAELFDLIITILARAKTPYEIGDILAAIESGKIQPDLAIVDGNLSLGTDRGTDGIRVGIALHDKVHTIGNGMYPIERVDENILKGNNQQLIERLKQFAKPIRKVQ